MQRFGDDLDRTRRAAKADFYDIDMIEKKFHEATTKKDIELMVSLWAPNATLTVGPGMTAAASTRSGDSGSTKSAPFDPENDGYRIIRRTRSRSR